MPVRAAQLDEPEVRGEPLREVHDEGRAVAAECVERGRQRARRVHDDQVALVEKLRKVVRVRVDEPQVVAVRDHHADCVARDATRFGRLGCFAHEQRRHGVTISKSAAR